MKPLEFGLVGKKLGHSFSADYFTKKFRELGLPHTYSLFEIPRIEELPALIQMHPNLAGLNVTLPYKEEVIPFLDHLSPEASAIGSVNTLKISDGKISGYNTDILGFRHSLDSFYPPNHNKTALLLGSGGSSKSIHYVLRTRWKPKEVIIVSRQKQGQNYLSWNIIQELDFSTIELIVNTTPLGMFPDVESCPRLPWEKIGPAVYLFDLVYNPAETEFLKRGRERGCRVKGGLEMLHLQADAAWEIWQKGAGQ